MTSLYFIVGLGLLITLSMTMRLKQRWQRLTALERGLERQDGGLDLGVISMIICIMGIGLVMVYSASFTKSNQEFGDPYHFLKRQAIFTVVGLLVMWGVSKINYRVWKPASYTLWGLSCMALMMVFVYGRSIKGAKRWLDLGVMNLQPVELVKVALLLAACRMVSEFPAVMPTKKWAYFKKVIPLGALVGLPAAALIKQPDYGSTLIVGAIGYSAFFLIGGSLWSVILAIILAVCAGIYMVLTGNDHVLRRVENFWKMTTGEGGPGYNVDQALVSFGSGQLTGQGIGNSSQRNFFLPEAHTDFIFDIYGEETGLIGVLILIALYTVIFIKGLGIARRAPSSYGGLLAAIISLLFFTQALTNMMMAIGLAPAKGLTLPLMSYGGSSMVIVCAMLGILLNISRRPSPPPERDLWLRFARLLDPLSYLKRRSR